MQDFRKLLKVKEEYGILGFRQLKRLKVGNYLLSIQASEGHYCVPRKSLKDIFDYMAMEVAIFDNKGNWCNLEHDKFFDDWKDREEFLDLYDGMVGAYTPIKLLQSLYDYIESRCDS